MDYGKVVLFLCMDNPVAPKGTTVQAGWSVGFVKEQHGKWVKVADVTGRVRTVYRQDCVLLYGGAQDVL